MSSIGSLLSIARSALSTHQAAILVTSNNVSNADTVGYSRQTAVLTPGPTIRESAGEMGSGVLVRDIQRQRDSLLDATYRREQANASGFTLRQDLLDQVQGVFGTLSGHGLDEALDAFWSAWSDLANQPSDPTSQGLVRDRGSQLAAMLNDASAQLRDARDTVSGRLTRDTAEFNRLAQQVADLNRSITIAEAGGQSAPAMRDERDRVLDAMSQIAPVRVIEHDNGTVGVLLDSTSVVDGDAARTLDVSAGPPVSLQLTGHPGAISPPGGALGASLDVLNQVIPDVQAQLDGLADGLVTAVNDLHVQGPSGVPFFQPAGASGTVSAAAIRLSDQVQADPSVINAGINDADTGPSDNRLALQIAGFRDTPVSITVASGTYAGTTSSTFGAFYGSIVTGIGALTQAAGQSATVYGTLADQADARRSAVSGVSTDEELTTLMGQQQAYAAAAHLVTVADEMARTILDMVS
jgi:flagellar hook-associated protein 1 FlgK